MSVDDIRINALKPLLAPAILMEDFPLSDNATKKIISVRSDATEIMQFKQKRLLVVVGPCSIHDDMAAREYAMHLKKLQEKFSDELCLIMRVYFEKPRTTIGWKGFIHDPSLDGSCHINHGIRMARKLLVDLAHMEVPAATEFLDTIMPQFISDAIAWAAIGARTTESQIHRQLASGLSMPVGFKNGTHGNVQIAIDAILTAQHPQHFLSVTKQGIPAIIYTKGNETCHLVLRGGQEPNYMAPYIRETTEKLRAQNLPTGIMVDCSHGNSQKNYLNQALVVQNLIEQISGGDCSIRGIMLESNLVGGRQDLQANKTLIYGQSITDACIGIQETEYLLENLARTIRKREN